MYNQRSMDPSSRGRKNTLDCCVFDRVSMGLEFVWSCIQVTWDLPSSDERYHHFPILRTKWPQIAVRRKPRETKWRSSILARGFLKPEASWIATITPTLLTLHANEPRAFAQCARTMSVFDCHNGLLCVSRLTKYWVFTLPVIWWPISLAELWFEDGGQNSVMP